MKTFLALLLYVAFNYFVSCGLIPSFSLSKDTIPPLNNSATNESTTVEQNVTTVSSADPTTTITTPDNLTTTVDQLIVPKAAIVNASDILSPKTNTENAISSTTYADENGTTTSAASENEIVVPKEAIDNSTLELAKTTLQPASSNITSNATATLTNEIVVPKTSISNGTLLPVVNETKTEESAEGLGTTISVHKRSVNANAVDYPDTSSAMFEKYDKWTGPGAITSQEISYLKNKGQWVEHRPLRKPRSKREEHQESSEDDVNVNVMFHSLESGSQEGMLNATGSSTVDSTSTSNATDATPTMENLENAEKQHLKDDVVDDDDESVCAVNKDDEEATKVVTIFWRSVFCVIFVIIIVYPIYSYTKIYCQKRKKRRRVHIER